MKKKIFSILLSLTIALFILVPLSIITFADSNDLIIQKDDGSGNLIAATVDVDYSWSGDKLVIKSNNLIISGTTSQEYIEYDSSPAIENFNITFKNLSITSTSGNVPVCIKNPTNIYIEGDCSFVSNKTALEFLEKTNVNGKEGSSLTIQSTGLDPSIDAPARNIEFNSVNMNINSNAIAIKSECSKRSGVYTDGDGNGEGIKFNSCNVVIVSSDNAIQMDKGFLYILGHTNLDATAGQNATTVIKNGDGADASSYKYLTTINIDADCTVNLKNNGNGCGLQSSMLKLRGAGNFTVNGNSADPMVKAGKYIAFNNTGLTSIKNNNALAIDTGTIVIDQVGKGIKLFSNNTDGPARYETAWQNSSGRMYTFNTSFDTETNLTDRTDTTLFAKKDDNKYYLYDTEKDKTPKLVEIKEPLNRIYWSYNNHKLVIGPTEESAAQGDADISWYEFVKPITSANINWEEFKDIEATKAFDSTNPDATYIAYYPFDITSGYTNHAWKQYKDDIYTVEIKPGILPCMTDHWFSYMKNLTQITGFENLFCKKNISINSMFNSCNGLTSMDFTNIDMSNVKYMNATFKNAKNIAEIKGLLLPNVQQLEEVFLGCESLNKYPLTGVDFAKVTNCKGAINCGYVDNPSCSEINLAELTNINGDRINELVGQYASIDHINRICYPANISDSIAIEGCWKYEDNKEMLDYDDDEEECTAPQNLVAPKWIYRVQFAKIFFLNRLLNDDEITLLSEEEPSMSDVICFMTEGGYYSVGNIVEVEKELGEATGTLNPASEDAFVEIQTAISELKEMLDTIDDQEEKSEIEQMINIYEDMIKPYIVPEGKSIKWKRVVIDTSKAETDPLHAISLSTEYFDTNAPLVLTDAEKKYCDGMVLLVPQIGGDEDDDDDDPTPGPTPGPTPSMDEQKFTEYKTTEISKLDKLAEEVTSDSDKAIVATAKADLAALKYDSTKTLAENEISARSIAEAAFVHVDKVIQTKLKAYKNGKIKVSWKALTLKDSWKVDTYQVYRKVGKKGKYKLFRTVKLGKKKTITYKNTKKLKKGKTYYYKVRGKVKLSDGTYAYTKWSNVKHIKCKKTRR